MLARNHCIRITNLSILVGILLFWFISPLADQPSTPQVHHMKFLRVASIVFASMSIGAISSPVLHMTDEWQCLRFQSYGKHVWQTTCLAPVCKNAGGRCVPGWTADGKITCSGVNLDRPGCRGCECAPGVWRKVLAHGGI